MQWLNIARLHRKIRHRFGKTVLLGIFLGYELIAEGVWKGEFLVADIEELENMGASEIHRRRINAKEVLTPQRREYFKFPVADGTAKLSGRVQEFREPTQRREQPVGSEGFSGEVQGEPEEFQPTAAKDDAEAEKDFWSIQGDFIYRHHIEPRVQLCVPKEETFRVPLNTLMWPELLMQILDVLQE